MVRYVSFVTFLAGISMVSEVLPARGSDAITFITETVDADGDVGDYRSTAVGNEGTVWIVYTKDQPGGAVSVRVAVDDASGWQLETVPISSSPTTDVILDAAAYPAFGYSDGLTLRYAFKSGGTWHNESIGGFGPWVSALTTSAAAMPFAAYVWSYHNTGYISVSARDAGWISLIQYENPAWFDPTSVGVDIAVDGAGNPHVCAKPTGSVFYYFFRSDTIWTELEEVPYYLTDISLAVDSQNRSIISYKGGRELRLAIRETGGWTTSVVSNADGCGGTDLTIDADDVPHIAYCHVDGGAAKVFYAVRSGPGGSWVTQEVGDGYGASMALDADGRPHIAYRSRVHFPAGWNLEYATTSKPIPVKIKSWGEVKSLYRPTREDD